jgi:8-oxo-dGTP pyrophosphatase MutT (NUDIX family)
VVHGAFRHGRRLTFADVVARLEHGLQQELPGPAAQDRLAPVPRRNWAPGFNPARARNAAGLILVFPKRKEATAEHAEIAEHNDSLRSPRSRRLLSDLDPAHIILTVRAEALRHGGQVSLPGGVVDPGETFEQAALREAHEEVALPLDEVRVLGPLTPLDIPVSGFRLHPIVAVHPTQPRLTPSDGEVSRILEIGVDDLMNPRHFVTTERHRDGVAFLVPAFRVAGVEIWGATAMVLAEFLALLA